MLTDLKAFLQEINSDLYDFFAHDLGLECGPQDGGCLVFAQALKAMLASVDVTAELYFCGRPSIGDHVVLKASFPDGEYYMDSDGCYSPEDLLSKCQRDHNPTDDIELFPYFLGHTNDIIDFSNIAAADRLYSRFQAEFSELFKRSSSSLSATV